MTLEEARAWLTSPAAQRYILALDDNANAATTAAERLLPQLRDYPAATVSGLRGMVQVLARAQGNFNTEVNLITFGRARDGRAVLAAYRGYVAALIRLEAETGRLSAYAEADIAALGERLLAAFSAFTDARVNRERRQALRRLQDWADTLNRAIREEAEAEVQRALNLGLAGVSLLISVFDPPVAAGIAISAGGLTLQLLIDVALGPGRPDALGVSNTAVGNLAGLPRAARPAIARFATGITALVGLEFDTNEVNDARRNVARATREMQRARREFEAMLDDMSAGAVQIGLARRMWDQGVARARAAARSVETTEREYRNLLRALESIE